MLQMNNIRFNYVQKDHNFTNTEHSPSEKQGVGRLLTKNERNRPFDEQQQQQISKKKTLYHGNSLNYSQIYSDIRINRNEKIQPRPQIRNDQFKYMNHYSNMISNKKQDLNKTQGLDQAKSLPKITKNSRPVSHSTPNQVDLNLTRNDLSVQKDNNANFSRGKAFSISHYDIYRPGFLVNRKSILSAQKESVTEDKIQEVNREQNNSIVKSEFQGELEKQMPQQPLKINFQNEQEKDLPENNVSQLNQSKNLSRNGRGSKASTYKFRGQPQKKIEEEVIEVQYSNTKVKKLKQSQIKHEKVQKVQHQQYEVIQKQSKVQKERKQSSPFEEVSLKNHNSLPQTLKISHLKDVKKDRQQGISVSAAKQQQKVQTQLRQSNDSKAAISVSKIQSNQKHLISAEKHQSNQKEVIFENKIHIKVQQKEQKEENVMQIKYLSQRNEEAQNGKQLANEKNIKQQSYRPYQYYKFNIEEYMKVYEILKNIHSFLKNPVLDSHNLIKQIKRYLQTVAGGSLDHLQGYDMPLHRLKIVKNALLFQRIAIVIVSFAYCVGKLKEGLKYIINLVSYAINNTLLILRILQNSDLTKEPSKNPIMAKSDRLVVKKNYDTVRNNNDIILDSIFKISKYEQAFSQSFKDILKSVGKSSLQQTFYNVLQYFAFFLCVSELHMTLPFLAVAPNPYLRQTFDKRPTLVIDIVQIFCHGTRKSKSHVFRPHTEHFLNEMSQYYEIVSFTCAYPNQIDKVIDIVDPKKHIKNRLYRHHAVWKNNLLYKQTERIGRDLNRLILLDSFTNTIKGQSNNTIMIPVWRGNKNDTTLAELCPILAAIAIKNLNCQEATRKIHQQQIKNESAGIKYLNFGINLE